MGDWVIPSPIFLTNKIDMKEKEFIKELTLLVNKCGLDSEVNLPDVTVAEYLLDSFKALSKIRNLNESKNEEDSFVDRMYSMYPTHCPKRQASLGKTRKDKERIKKLLKVYSMDEIERVFKHEIQEKQGKHYMQNFSTFLNNFPDPNTLDNGNLFSALVTEEPNSYKPFNESINIDGQIYR